MKPTCTRRLPKATSASTILRQPSAVTARGFSQNTELPAAMAASTNSSWLGPQEVTRIASTCGELINAWPSAYTSAVSFKSATTLAACSRLMSVTATTWLLSKVWLQRRIWSRPMAPVPITPNFKDMETLLLLLVLPGLGQAFIELFGHRIGAFAGGHLRHTDTPPRQVFVDHGFGQDLDIDQRRHRLQLQAGLADVRTQPVS